MQPEKIKELRKKLNMTQEQFARKIGVAYFTVVRWENKMNHPSRLALEKLENLELEAKKLELSITPTDSKNQSGLVIPACQAG